MPASAVLRDGENRTTQLQQQRKLARLKDAQASIMQRYQEADKRFKTRNAELTEEYRRITKQYKDLQQKFRLFEAADARKFQEVWAMHEETVGAMMKRLLDADKVIHEQLLGWEWEPPSQELLGTFTPGATAAASAAAAAAAVAAAPAVAPLPEEVADSTGAGAGQADGLAAVIEAKRAEEHSDRLRVMLEVCVCVACRVLSVSAADLAMVAGGVRSSWRPRRASWCPVR